MHQRPLTKNDLKAVRQAPGETLRKYIQRFSQVRNKVPRISDADIISAFAGGVTDVRMHEKLGVHVELSSVVKLFEMADKCAKAEEGRLFAHNDRDLKKEEANASNPVKALPKRKPQIALAAEPEHKQPRAADDAGRREDRTYCIFHDMHGHNTDNCYKLRRY